MPTYPSISKNMSTSSPSNRNELYTGENVFNLDREQTSFVALFNIGKDFVNNKNDSSLFKDFYAGSIGTTLLELQSGFSELRQYYAITSRRESYLYEAQLRDSGIAISSNLGYSVFRGNNVKLTLTIIPSMDISISKFDIIGSYTSGDIISLEDKDLELGKATDIEVILGELKITDLTINDGRTYTFRFNNDKISEDLMLKLDNKIVPTSNILYDLLDDKFVIMSNPVGGIDVLYLNRFQPEKWIAFSKYTFFDYALPTYDWRPLHLYKEGDIVNKVAPVDAMPIMYRATRTGTSGRLEPTWNEDTDTITSDGLQLSWQCIGQLQKQLYVRCISPGVNITGAEEPNWPFVLGETVVDGNCTWILTDTFDASKHFYNSGSILELTYVELNDVQYEAQDLQLDIGVVTSTSIETPYQSQETLTQMRRNAPLYNETRYVVRGREDFRKIFRMETLNAVDANGFDPIPAVVDLSYVKDHTNKVWSPDKMTRIGDEVLSTIPNNYIYRATSSGYTGLSRKGTSGTVEPTWIPEGYKVPERKEDQEYPDIPQVEDYQVVWEARYIPEVGIRPNYWQSNTRYELGQQIAVHNADYYFEAVKFNTEPVWPTEIGQTVRDNEVNWICTDTIFFDGYEAQYWSQGLEVKEGDFIEPVSSNGYFYVCTQPGVTGSQEPDWPIVICETVDDNTAIWQCYDRTDAPKYIKNRVLERIDKYRPYGVAPCIMDDPKLVMVYLHFDITTMNYVDDATINNDIFSILDEYQRVLESYVDVETLENRIEDIDYIKIARAKIVGNTKAVPWKQGTLYRVKDVVYPVPENGYYYIANRIQTGGYGYTQWSDRAYSSSTEPEWQNVQVFDHVKDSNLVWQIRYTAELGGIIPEYWEPDTVYNIDSCVMMPSRVNDTKYYAKVVQINYVEPDWPTVPGKSILDGRIYWTCFDPNRSFSCGWNEYMMFSWDTTVTRYKK